MPTEGGTVRLRDVGRSKSMPAGSSWNTERTRKKHKTSRNRLSITLSFASRLIGKHLATSRQLISAGDLWKNTLPSHDCDVIVTFPPSTSDSTMVWLLTRLKARVPELIVDVKEHRHSGVFGLYLTATFEDLLKGAENIRLRKKLKPEYGGGMKEFLLEEEEFFEMPSNKNAFFTSQERQSIVMHMLNSLQAVKGERLLSVNFVEGQSIVPRCLSEGVISQVFPLHSKEDLQKLKETWVKAFFSVQPLDAICEYFGVKIAIYFAWLGHYTSALTLPAIFGLILWICFYGRNQALEDLCFVVFALFNVLWATLYLEAWKRYCAELAYRWGTLDTQSELLTEPRPLFSGPLSISPVTGRLEPTYPEWKRNVFRYLVSYPIIITCLFVVFVVMFLIFELQTWWDSTIKSLEYPFWLSVFPKILLGLVINIMDGLYIRIAHWLNNKENYRLDEDYENHLVYKIVVFQFVNSFLSLFYIAFYLQDMEKLKEQLAALLITRQVVGNIKESLIPFLTETYKFAYMGMGSHNPPLQDSSILPRSRKAHSEESTRRNDIIATSVLTEEKDGEKSETDSFVQSLHCERNGTTSQPVQETASRLLTQAEVESSMYKYEGTFEDYLEMFIQFGYVILFSSAFPMAGLCALLNNLIEIRSDAFKLCVIFQRPFGQRVENIGTWEHAMEFMGIIAVIVNSALIGMSGQMQRMFPYLSTTGTIVVIVILEHIILAMKFGIAYAIPDVPEWVATEMAKVEFQRREAAKRVHSSSLVSRQRRRFSSISKMAVHSHRDSVHNHEIRNPSLGPKLKDASCQTVDLNIPTEKPIVAPISEPSSPPDEAIPCDCTPADSAGKWDEVQQNKTVADTSSASGVESDGPGTPDSLGDADQHSLPKPLKLSPTLSQRYSSPVIWHADATKQEDKATFRRKRSLPPLRLIKRALSSHDSDGSTPSKPSSAPPHPNGSKKMLGFPSEKAISLGTSLNVSKYFPHLPGFRKKKRPDLVASSSTEDRSSPSLSGDQGVAAQGSKSAFPQQRNDN